METVYYVTLGFVVHLAGEPDEHSLRDIAEAVQARLVAAGTVESPDVSGFEVMEVIRDEED